MKKRALLIVTGTVGALGGVFAITPPQFGNSASGVSGASDVAATPAPVASSTPTESAPTSTPNPASTPAHKQSSKTATPAPTKSEAAPTPTPEVPTPTPTKAASSKVTVTGNTYAANEGGRNWGNVTVRVTFTDGQITAISGTQSPMSRGQWAFDQLDPYVSGQKITIAQIKSKNANALPYVSGVSYSSMAYWESLKSAISKAGL
jgi:uncharacterized protein with FMN-binding domain